MTADTTAEKGEQTPGRRAIRATRAIPPRGAPPEIAQIARIAHAPDLHAKLDRLLDGQERLEAMLERLVPVAENSADLPSFPEPVPALVRALADAFGDALFTSSEAWRRASEHAGLSEALRAEGIMTTHGLGRRLADYEGQGIDRPPYRDHGSSLWRVGA